MTLSQYLASYPTPVGTLKFGNPCPRNDGVNFCTYGLASEILSQIMAAISAIGTTSGLPSGTSAPALSDGTAVGGAYSGYTLLNPPSTPPLPTDISAWVISGWFITTQPITVPNAGGPATIPAGTLVQINTENVGELNARMVVIPQLQQAIDKNVLYAPYTGQQYVVYTSYGIALNPSLYGGSPLGMIYCIAP